MRSIFVMAGAAAFVLGATTVVGQSQLAPAAAIKARQQQYREIGTAFKAVNDELRKSSPGKFAMGSSARQIAANLRQVNSMFPAGSGPSSGIKTKALATIWSKQPEFQRLNAAAVVAADKLVLAMRGTDNAAMTAQAQAVGRSCKACHSAFRAED